MLERFLGVSDREARLNVEAELGRSLPDDFETQMKQAALQRYANELQAIPYVADVIAAITLPKCVASSGTPEKVRHGLTCAGLSDLLVPNVFSATGQAWRQRPIYLYAAAQMVSPERSLVIEDKGLASPAALAADRARFSRW